MRSGNPMTQAITLHVNARRVDLCVAPQHTLLEVLRGDLGLTGTKYGCELGECGACTVLVDGEPRLACLTLAVEAAGCAITTVEGLAPGAEPHPLQTAFVELGAAQCGYCTSGMLVTAKALLDQNPVPSREEVQAALAGNLCRCTGYVKILDAVQLAARRQCASDRPVELGPGEVGQVQAGQDEARQVQVRQDQMGQVEVTR